MGLMDKVKEQAAQALNKAQQGVSQGKAKIDEVQAKHQWDALLRNLGAAVYAEKREGGSGDAVTAALAALDSQAEQQRAAAAAAAADSEASSNGSGGDGGTSSAAWGNGSAGTSPETATGGASATGEGPGGESTPEA